jgi:hypothetical protein
MDKSANPQPTPTPRVTTASIAAAVSTVIQALMASIQHLHPLPSVWGSYLKTILMIQTSNDLHSPPPIRSTTHQRLLNDLLNQMLRPQLMYQRPHRLCKLQRQLTVAHQPRPPLVRIQQLLLSCLCLSLPRSVDCYIPAYSLNLLNPLNLSLLLFEPKRWQMTKEVNCCIYLHFLVWSCESNCTHSTINLQNTYSFTTRRFATKQYEQSVWLMIDDSMILSVSMSGWPNNKYALRKLHLWILVEMDGF